MARSKRREHKYPVKKSSADPQSPEAVLRDRIDLTDYLLLNGLFAAFCLLQLVIIRVLLPNALGLVFFFGFLVVAFAVVSAFDYMASKLTDDSLPPQEEQLNR